MAQWFWAVRGQQPQGPFSLDDLRALIASGQVGADAVVWHAGAPNWLPFSGFPELAQAPTFSSGTPPSLRTTSPTIGASGPPPHPGESTPTRSSSGFLVRLHSLPKPVLFGLYGALGGLLGVLLFGEILWYLLSPATQQIPPLKAAVSPTVTVYPGGQNKFTVKIARHGFTGPVRVDVLDVPEEVKAPSLTIAQDAEEGDVDVFANAARLGSHQLKVKVRSLDREEINVTEIVRLSIEPTILIALSPSVTVYPGDKNRFPVKIIRRSFEGDVRLEVVDPPAGVTVSAEVIPANQSDAELEVSASDRAPPGVHTLKVMASAFPGKEPTAAQTLDLNIKSLPPSLKMAVAPAVTVFQGEKNKFGVKIARYRFDGPVKLEVAGATPDITIAPVTVPADKSEAELEVVASKTALGGAPSVTTPLRVTARSTVDKETSASASLRLKIESAPPTVQLAVSPKAAVYAGDRVKFKVKIARARFEGLVTVQLVGAPGYISATPITIPRDQIEGDMELTVADAALREGLPKVHTLRVNARGFELPREASERLELEIVPPPLSLRVTASPEVEIYQGSKCRFTVRIARTGFLGPVLLEVKDPPMGLTISPVFMPEGETEGFMEGAADKTLKVGKLPLTLQASGSAPGKEAPFGLAQFLVDVKPYDPNRKPPPLDIVFALDVTGSMGGEINGVRDGIESFMKELQRNKLEARVGLVAFRDVTDDPPEKAIQLLRFGAGPFTSDPLAFRREVAKLDADGGGDTPESSYEALVKAASYPYRPQAMKILVLITDASPQTVGKSIREDEVLRSLDLKKIDQLHVVSRREEKAIYDRLQAKAKGTWFELSATARSGFATLLPILSKEIARISIAAGPAAPLAMAPPPLPAAKDAPKLPEVAVPVAPPADAAAAPPKAELPPSPPPEGITNPRVTPAPPVAAAAAPPRAEAPALKAVQSTQLYDEKDRLQLMFAIAIWTAVMAAGIGLLLVLGQKLYLQKTLPGVAEMAKALGTGLGAGLLGGFLGQLFYQTTSGGTAWDILSRVTAWGLLGSLLGAGMALFVPNLKWHRALLGGLIGGLIGALGFTLFSFLAGSLLGRWIGAALVGFCIGLMIAWAELAFRRSWLEITFGAREVRTVTLGTSLVAIGSDERQTSVYVPGAAPRALGYRLEGDRVLCEDFTTGKTFEVRPGDQKTIGGVRIAVRGVADAPAGGMTLRLAKGKTIQLMEGMPITAEDIPGLEPQGADGIVALISRRPANPHILLLRNRSKQAWHVTMPGGQTRDITPGLGMELAGTFKIDFGKTQGVFSMNGEPAERSKPDIAVPQTRSTKSPTKAPKRPT